MLNVVAVYSRVAQKNANSHRIRRRLEAYGFKVNGLYGILDESIVDNQLGNTGLTGVYLASIFSKQITIYGLDFYSMPYINGSNIDENHLIIKRNLNREEFGKQLVNKFMHICSNFNQVEYLLNTYYDLSEMKILKNLTINKVG